MQLTRFTDLGLRAMMLLAAGEALLAADMWHSTGAFMGAILLQSGALLVSVAMLRTRVFGRPTAWVGILTHGLDLVHVVLGPFAPGAAVADPDGRRCATGGGSRSDHHQLR